MIARRFDLYRDLLEQWGAPALAVEPVIRTDAAIDLWQAWRRNDLTPRGRRLLRVASAPVLAVWIGGPDRPLASFTTIAELETWLRPERGGPRLTASISDLDGQPVVGRTLTGAISLTPGETRLPFVLRASAADAATGESIRRLVALSALVVTSMLMLAAAIGVYRATMPRARVSAAAS